MKTLICSSISSSMKHSVNSFMQEHTVHFIIRLLSPPVPTESVEGNSHLINYAPILNVLIVGLAPVDCVQTFSLHGLVNFIPNLK